MKDIQRVDSEGFKIPAPRRPSAFKPFLKAASKADYSRQLDSMRNYAQVELQAFYQNLLLKFFHNPKLLSKPEIKIVAQMPVVKALMAERAAMQESGKEHFIPSAAINVR